MSEPKPSLEPLLVPDLEMQRKQAVCDQKQVYAECPRQLNDHGRWIALMWFEKNYEPDPSLEEEAYDVYGSFTDQYVDGPDAHHAFVEALRSAHPVYEGDHVLVGPLSDATAEPCFRARRRSAIKARVGHSSRAEPIEWLIEGILPKASVGMIVGASYELKTWVAMALEKAVAHREPWMGRAFDPTNTFRTYGAGADPVPTFPRVLHLNYEMPDAEVTNRLELLGEYPGAKTRMMTHQGEQIEVCESREGRIHVASHPEVDLDSDAFWDSLTIGKYDLVTVDTLSAANPSVDEKDSRFAKPLQRAAAFAKKHGTAFLFVHHSPKCTGSESLLEIIRGSSAIAAALDVAFFVKKVSRFATKDPKERRSIVVCKKMRRGGDEPAPFTVKLTDAGGLELHEERRGKAPKAGPQTDEDVLYEAIKATPGIGGRRALVKATGLSKERVHLAYMALLNAVRIENRGSTASPSLFVTAAV